MEIEFFPYDYDYVDRDNKDIIKIFGRTSDKKTICVLDNIDNFFYVLSNKSEDIQKDLEKFKIKSEIVSKKFLENPVQALKVYCMYKQYRTIRERILSKDEKAIILEEDIHPITRYIIEKNCRPLIKQNISGKILNNSEEFNGLDNMIDTDIVLKLNSINENKNQEAFDPKVLAFDIETEEFEIGKGAILMIAVVGKSIKKVLTWKHEKTCLDFVEFYNSEEDMIEAFQKIIEKENPDIITGYFSDNFDLPYIRARAEKLKVDINLSRDNSKIIFSRGARLIKAKTKGRPHIDIFRFIETAYAQYMQSESLTLDEVASELLGESKIKIDHLSKQTHEIKDHEWDEFFEYNLHDAILTFKLFEKIWPDLIGFTEVMQEPIFDVSRDGMSQHVEDYIIHNLKRFNEIAMPKPSHSEISKRRSLPPNIGAFVLQPNPELYEDLGMFDFTSYWPSIIVTFNLSRSTYLRNKKQNNSHEVDIEGKKYYFSRSPGFFPTLLAEIIEKRKQYKKELKEHPDALKKARSNAYKVLANASYGYLGFFGARYYCYEAQGATTGISREFIKNIIEKVNKKGYKVIYADTDGFAFKMNNKSKEDSLKFLKELNKDLPGIMELELEDFYKRGIWVTKRTGEFGAKKKYALINEQGKLKIRGFETVRRDWCRLARDLQSDILKMILEDGNGKRALEHTKKVAEKVQKRKIEKKQLIIKSQLRRPLEEYKAETPHVTIARKMIERNMPVSIGTLIEFYIAEPEGNKKKALVRERAKLPEETVNYDIDYYMNKQILPAVENIFQVLNIDIKSELEEKKQKSLKDF
jgi:DNA polymerase I/DNA polymerase-2